MNTKKLDIALIERNKTRTDLANFLSISKAQMSKIMNGKSQISIGRAKQIISFLHLSKDETNEIFFG